MAAAVVADRLPDLTLDTRPLVLGPAQLAALAAVPNVAAVEPRSLFSGQVYVGARRALAQVRGIADFMGRRERGAPCFGRGPDCRPGAHRPPERQARLLDAHGGETLRVVAADGTARHLRVSGEGRNLEGPNRSHPTM